MGNVQIVNFDSSNYFSQSEFEQMHVAYDESGRNVCKQIVTGLVGKEARNSSARQKAKRAITKTTFRHN